MYVVVPWLYELIIRFPYSLSCIISFQSSLLLVIHNLGVNIANEHRWISHESSHHCLLIISELEYTVRLDTYKTRDSIPARATFDHQDLSRVVAEYTDYVIVQHNKVTSIPVKTIVFKVIFLNTTFCPSTFSISCIPSSILKFIEA